MDWETVQTYINEYGYLAVAIGTLWDHSGLALFIVAGGAMAAVDGGLHVWGVILAGAAGQLLSDLIFYGVGRWRAQWLDRVVRSRKGRLRLAMIGEAMQRRAIPVLAFGRFLPWVGRFVPAAAGIRRVTFRRAVASCLGGALLAGLMYALIGYFASNLVMRFHGMAFWFVAGALVLSVPAARWVLKRFDREVERRIATAQKAAVNE